MFQVTAKYWWAFALRGCFAILFGLLAFIMTGWEPYNFARAFCVFALLEGLLAIVPSLSSAAVKIWWLLMFEGIAGMVLGIFSFLGPGGIGSALFPDASATTAFILIAFWALITGIFEVLSAIRLSKGPAGRWALAAAGGLSILFGVTAVILRPAEGVTASGWLVGIYFILFGALLIYLGLGFRENGNTKREA